MMDKKLIEKYLKLYPRIDDEIKDLEDDIEYFKKMGAEYDKKDAGQHRDDILASVKNGLIEKQNILQETASAKIQISIALSRMNMGQRKIIELRFWNDDPFPTEWAEIACKLRYHRKSLEKIYSQIVDEILIS